jgi:glycosyltransferase involved in cell wall biosynthesis
LPLNSRSINRSRDRTTVGVVIRTLDESEFLGRCLEALQRQRGSFNLDVLVVDSGSTDGTIEIARSHDARVVELPPGEFDYSKSLNLGIANVSGEIVISLSAHAIPVDEMWLESMVGAFEDPQVAGVSSRQVPWPGAHWKEVKRLGQVFGVTRLVYGLEDLDQIVFSNAASAIRRSVWMTQPFTLPAVEDLDWARRVVTVGWNIVYQPEATVYHSHDERARAQARRLIDIARAEETALSPRTLRRTIREAAGLLRRDSRSIFALDEPVRAKLEYATSLVRTAYYYVVDFSRPGTTADHRRAESRHRQVPAADTADRE